MFTEQIKKIFFEILKLDNLNINDLQEDSWFSILWNPFKSTKTQFTNTSFISVYGFEKFEKEKVIDLNQSFRICSIKGILPIKVDHSLFFCPICKN